MFYNTRIQFNSRDEARDYLYKLLAKATDNGRVTVADILDDFKITPDDFDYEWSWTPKDIRLAELVEEFDWSFKLPDPKRVCDTPTTSSLPDPEIATLNIVLHANEVADPDAALTEIFKHIQSIKDRMVNLSIM